MYNTLASLVEAGQLGRLVAAVGNDKAYTLALAVVYTLLWYRGSYLGPLLRLVFRTNIILDGAYTEIDVLIRTL